MLSVLYKIASASIANQIKPYLDHLISPSQTGFVSGRYIGDSTRLVYDIMNFTETKNIPGLLMLIDFEKAFDSISWNFIHKTLTYLGLGETVYNGYNYLIKIYRQELYIVESHQKSSILAEVVDKATQVQLIYIFWLDRYNLFLFHNPLM